jgi:L-cysteine:1D-myo-inositol 2-amino-2-deoxy-alpha-D-glucopyranoside ligase
MIGLDGEKMSKSKGNLVFVSKLISAGVDPMVIRFALISQHYRKDRMWSDEALADATERVARIREALVLESVGQTDNVITAVINALSRDLDTPAAIYAVEEWAEQSINGATGGVAHDLSTALDALLGLAL